MAYTFQYLELFRMAILMSMWHSVLDLSGDIAF